MVEVLETVSAKRDKREPIRDEFRGRGRNNYLPTVSRRCDPGGMMNIGANVTLFGEERRSGVHAHPQSYRPRGEPLRDRLRSLDRAPRVRERQEERISLGIDLDAAAPRRLCSNKLPVLGKRVGIRLSSELTKNACRSLDVREDECHNSGREITHCPG
jgi:hypothetical protein